MNNTFNFKRFAMLFKKHTLEHAKNNLLSFGVLIGLLFAALGFCSYVSHGLLSQSIQMLIFAWFLLLGGSIFTSLTFMDLSDKKKIIPVLTLPVSHFEKYLVGWIYSFILFQLILLGAFYLADSVVITMGAPVTEDNFKVVNVFVYTIRPVSIFVMFAGLHAFCFWGAIFFNKLHFIKTAFSFFFVVLVVVVLNNQLLKLLVTDSTNNAPFGDLQIITKNHFFNIEANKNITVYGWPVLILGILLLWTSAFFRLKEKEA